MDNELCAALHQGEITQFQEDFCRKGTQRGKPQPDTDLPADDANARR